VATKDEALTRGSSGGRVMMTEAAASLGIGALVIARAINILK
jgi:hypothetical protein